MCERVLYLPPTYFQKYRLILNSDIVHVRRGDMQSIDSFLHANPDLPVKGLAMFFNPTQTALKEELEINLYYTGLEDWVTVSMESGEQKTLELDRGYNVYVEIGKY